MALPSSGAISLNQMHVEAGGSSGTNCSINDADIRGLISKGSGANMSFSEWYGASNVVTEGPQYNISYSPASATRIMSRVYIEYTGAVLDYYGWGTTGGSTGPAFKSPSDSSLYFNSSLSTFNYGVGATVSSGWYHFVKHPCTSYIQFQGGIDEGVYQKRLSIWRSTSTTYPF